MATYVCGEFATVRKQIPCIVFSYIFLSILKSRFCEFTRIKLTKKRRITSPQVLRGWVRKFCHRYYNFVNKHDRLLYYTLTERATFLLYNDVKIIPVRNKYLEIDTLKDTSGKTNGTFPEFVNIIVCVSCVISS